MTLINKKRTLFGGFFTMLAAVIIMASCANDTGSTNGDRTAASADTIASAPADTTTAKIAVKKKKGKASAIVSTDNTLKIEKDKEGVYTKAEKMPEYPGGEAALTKFVETNINYPQDAIDQNTEGTVNVSFVINEKGKVIDPVASGKTAGHGLDEEAVKMVKQMPAWKPGLVKGKPVKTRLSLPVTFKLADA